MLLFKSFSCRRIAAITLSFLTVLAAAYLSVMPCNLSVALQVDYDGKNIATIKNEADFDAAVEIVSRTVCGSNVTDALKEPVYTEVLVPTRQLDSKTDIAQAIIENTDEIITAQAVTVNGETVCCVTEDGLTQLLDDVRCRFDCGQNPSSRFSDDVQITEGYYLSDEIVSLETARSTLENLTVETVYTAVCEKETAYQTQKIKTDELAYGKTEVKVKGQNGLEEVTETVVMKNGTVVNRTETDSVIYQEVIDEVIYVGTKRNVSSNVAAQGFTFPLPRGGWVVSAYYGDGRNHRGIDLACDRGTPIYSVLSGTVESAGWEAGGYGYSVVINHGNGIKTRYAHASALYVSAGQQVVAGENIAAVGCTGNASGNHLHFEVIINGNRVNPASYIGL